MAPLTILHPHNFTAQGTGSYTCNYPCCWRNDRCTLGGKYIYTFMQALATVGRFLIDLARFLAGAAITSVSACGLGNQGAGPADNATISLRFADGSMAQIIYLANGHRAFPKERVEVFAAGRVLQLDNFRILRGFGWSGFRTMRLWRQDKGINACAAAFVDAIAGGRPSPIPAAEAFEVAQATLEAADQLARGEDTNLSAAQRSMMSAISLPELPRP